MVNAKNFYEVSVARQRKIIRKMIHEARPTGDPIIILPFFICPDVQEELLEDDWRFIPYTDESTGKKCTMLYPKQCELVNKD